MKYGTIWVYINYSLSVATLYFIFQSSNIQSAYLFIALIMIMWSTFKLKRKAILLLLVCNVAPQL